jgi:hypothetical protein
MKAELVIIRELFERATKWGYCRPIVVPPVKVRKKPDNRRPGLSGEE